MQKSKIIGDDVKLQLVPTDDNRSYHISSKKIKDELGFMPEKKIDDAIIDLKTAFAKGLLPNSLKDKILNIKTMQNKFKMKTKFMKLGDITSKDFMNDPKRLGIILSRYKFVGKMFEDYKSVLEIGAGDGFKSLSLKDSFKELTLSDIKTIKKIILTKFTNLKILNT